MVVHKAPEFVNTQNHEQNMNKTTMYGEFLLPGQVTSLVVKFRILYKN